jgi:nicotinamidase/pyrazinamidase
MGAREDAYSCFEGRDAGGRSLATILAERDVRKLYVVGLATDYCVKHSALDGRKAGLEVVVLTDACRGVNVQPGDAERAIDEMRAAGAVVA